MGLAVNQCVAPAALVVSKPMLAAAFINLNKQFNN